jgi:hypothetical protein
MAKEETELATRVIQEYLELNLPPVNWTDEDSPVDGIQADIYGVTDRSYIFIEIEMSRESPLDNVGKVVLENRGNSEIDKNVCLVQVFSNFYDVKGGYMLRRKEMCELIGGHYSDLIDNLEYHHLNLDTTPSRPSDKKLRNEPEPESVREGSAREVAIRIPQLLL